MDNRYESLEWSIIHIVSALIRTRNELAAVLALIPVEARDIFHDYVANIEETIETFYLIVYYVWYMKRIIKRIKCICTLEIMIFILHVRRNELAACVGLILTIYT